MLFRSLLVASALLLSGASQTKASDPAPKPLLVADNPLAVHDGPGLFYWMAADPKNHRVIAAHKAAGDFSLVDTKTDTMIPSIKTGAAQGVAVDEAGGKYYVGIEDAQKVIIFNSTTLAKTGEISVPGPVNALAYDPKHGLLYADHDGANEVWVINPSIQHIIATIALPGNPEYIEYDPVSDRVYQNIKDNDTIQVIDPSTNKITASWSTAPAASPYGLAIDSKNGRVFTAGRNGILAMLDIKTGKVLSSVAIGPRPTQIAFDAVKKRVYCACTGQISVVRAMDKSLKLIGAVGNAFGAETLTVDPVTHAVWSCYSDNHISYFVKYIAQ